MSIAIVGTVGTLAAAGYGAYSTYSNGKKADAAQQAALGGANLGRVPEAAEYMPVNFDQEQINAILGNANALDEIKALMKGGNRMITNDALKRANRLIPGYSDSMRAMGMNANDLLNARLPADVVEKLISDRAGASNGIGIPGLAGPATLKDLGLTSLDAINQGTGMLGKMVSMAETISPRSGYINPKDSMVSPGDRIRLTMEQNALIQQSQQSKNNLEAGANPGDVARLGVQLGQGSGGSGVNWGQLGGSVASALTQGYQAAQGGGGGYNASTGYYTSPGALTNAYATPGYTPIYGTNNQGSYFQYYQPVAA